jgi:UDP-N-acetylglucosamine acyltransferase
MSNLRVSVGAVVHPGAHVDPAAVLEDGVQIGPGAVVGPEVHLERGVRVGANAVLAGRTRIGADARIFPGAVIGEEPQDLKYKGERSSVVVGARTCIREHVTIHRSTSEGGTTVVGADVLLMANSHVAHDCRIGDRVVLCNGALLAGHIEVEPQAFVSGNVVIHQFTRIGRLAMIGGGSRVGRDVPPYALLIGYSRVRGVNGVGIRRAGFSREAQVEIREAYHELFRSGAQPRDALPKLAETLKTPEARALLDFLAAPSKRGLCGMGESSAGDDSE